MDIAAATTQTNLATLGTTAVNSEQESARENSNPADNEVRESQQTSSNEPAFVANISASSLESSRALNATASNETQNRVDDVIQAQTTAQTVPTNERLSTIGNQTLQQSRVDTVV